MEIRDATEYENKLLHNLLEATDWRPFQDDWEADLKVESMKDGGMGSFLLFPKGVIKPDRRFGRQVCSITFHDIDQIPVHVSLNLDKDGDLFEVDVWKVDYSPVVKLNLSEWVISDISEGVSSDDRP